MRKAIFWYGLKNEGLECFLQPIYNVKEKKINVAEALFRVGDGHGSYQDTEQLIQYAEKMDCVSRIDMWMLEQVCMHMRHFEQIGIKRINVNLSSKSYLDEDLVEDIRNIMRRYRVRTDQIWFELTEIAEVEDKEKMLKMVSSLCEEGFHFAIDDFGKGNSNILRLLELPFCCIKLDKELVWRLVDHPMTMDMIRMLMEFSKKYHICVTAEGIENREQADTLMDMGCDYLQGYMISKPLPIQEFIPFIEKYGLSFENNGYGEKEYA